ncbi:MAG TPA: hypothetical protein V6C90_17495 [Coleofasciculaceae cyanobacterium]
MVFSWDIKRWIYWAIALLGDKPKGFAVRSLFLSIQGEVSSAMRRQTAMRSSAEQLSAPLAH